MSSYSRRRAHFELTALEDRAVPSAAAPTLATDPNSYASDSILVRLKADAPRVLAAVAPGAELHQPLALVDGLWSVQLAAGESVPAALAAARADPYVQYAEPNYILHAATTPNDPRYTDGTLWGMNRISMPAAWDVSTGGATPGTGTLVAVIDTGVDYTHPDLAANIWTNPGEVDGDGIDNDGNGFIDDVHGWNFINNTPNVMDDNSHGTHVSGTIAGLGNNSVGVVGVNWAAQIMALKFLDASGSGTTDAAIEALNYAVMMGARVSNNSYGGGGFSQANLNAFTAAANAGHLIVCAAGNATNNNDTNPFYPASYKPSPDNVISVAATDSTDKVASFSNYGATTVDLAAPGVNIYSTVPGGYGYKSGTSMATPHVVGAAALLWAADPNLSMSDVRSRILGGTDSIAALNPTRPTVTNGRLNVANALSQAAHLTVNDVSVSEGNSGTMGATFTVTLSAVAAQTVTVHYATADGTATVAGSDYQATSGTLTFDPGVTSRTVTVLVNGDTQPEVNETFTLNLSSPVNAQIQDAQGVGTIVNDDQSPTISISDYQATEGNRGTKPFTFTVSLSAVSGSPVTVQYSTASGTATTKNKDYNATSGTLTFAAGETSKTVTVLVKGDTKRESNETFFVNLSSPTGATILDGQGVGTILNDD